MQPNMLHCNVHQSKKEPHENDHISLIHLYVSRCIGQAYMCMRFFSAKHPRKFTVYKIIQAGTYTVVASLSKLKNGQKVNEKL